MVTDLESESTTVGSASDSGAHELRTTERVTFELFPILDTYQGPGYMKEGNGTH